MQPRLQFDHTPETAPPIEYADPAYTDLMSEVGHRLPPNHHITYAPFTPEQEVEGLDSVTYVGQAELPGIMKDADAIICISRDEDPNEDYSDQHPEYNTQLTPSGRSNVDTSVAMYHMAKATGNDHVKFIATGRMHNRAVRMMLALPVVAEFIGIRAEDAYHTTAETFRTLLDRAFTAEKIVNLKLDASDENVGANHKALITLLTDAKYGASVPTADSTAEELTKAKEAIWQEYLTYPRVSVSRLMAERAHAAGVPLEDIVEEDGAVDTITNFVNTVEMLQTADGLQETELRHVVVVAGSDHLPRTTWIADHILPDGPEIVCVESDPTLSKEDYDTCCVRELKSFRMGSVWIGGTRDLGKLAAITDKGYFGVERVDTRELERQVDAEETAAAVLDEDSQHQVS